MRKFLLLPLSNSGNTIKFLKILNAEYMKTCVHTNQEAVQVNEKEEKFTITDKS